VLVVDPATGNTVRSWQTAPWLKVCALSPDGKRCVTAGLHNAVRLWDVERGQELRSWTMPPQAPMAGYFVAQMTFTSDGRHVVTANANTTLFLLELP
jgi:WD40 repeat protein